MNQRFAEYLRHVRVIAGAAGVLKGHAALGGGMDPGAMHALAEHLDGAVKGLNELLPLIDGPREEEPRQ